MNIQSSKEQKNILIELLIFVICIIIVFFFLYLPRSFKAGSVRDSLDKYSQEIKQIKSAAGEGLGPEETKKILAKKLEVLELKFPSKEEEIIKRISQVADDLNIEVLSISPGGKTALKDFPKIEGKECYVLPIVVEMNCEFIKIVNYINELTDNFPSLLTVEGLTLSQSSTEGLIGVRLSLNSYLLLEENLEVNNG